MIIKTLKIMVPVALIAGVVYSADIDIVKEGRGKSLIDISALKTSGSNVSEIFRDTLSNDLRLSGWFNVVSGGSGGIYLSGDCIDSGKYITVRCKASNPAAGKVYLDDSFNDQSVNVRRLAHAVADRLVLKIKGVAGIASSRIVMIGAKSGKKDLFICDYDGGNMMQITMDGVVCISPSWGPDAASIVYTAFLGGFPDVYKIDLSSNRRKRIVGYPGLNSGADISHDGMSMAVVLSKDGNPDLYVKDLKSDRLTRLTRTGHAAESSPSWSPDGSRIVYVSDETGTPRLYVIGRKEGTPKRITFRGGEDVAPNWGPSGLIVYSKKAGSFYQINVIDPKSGESTPLSAADADYEDPCWAPDGRHIVCSRTAGYRSDLYILDTLGDSPVRLTKIDGDWYSPSWSSK